MNNKVRIEIDRDVRESLKDMGRIGDTYNTLLTEMIRVYTVYRAAMLKKNADKSD